VQQEIFDAELFIQARCAELDEAAKNGTLEELVKDTPPFRVQLENHYAAMKIEDPRRWKNESRWMR
jgi:hypothetical protein